jgi:pimeloyl-ACP methyl ester carboxylesterase
VVFLHRFRGTLDDWDPAFIDAVATTRDIILFSDAGLGSSTGELATSIKAKSRNAAALIRRWAWLRLTCSASRWAGSPARRSPSPSPELVRKVVLVGSGPGPRHS